MNKEDYSNKLGDQLIIWITGLTSKYIAEVIQEDPLYLKVEESGPFSRLKEGDYIILKIETAAWQRGGEEKQLLLRAGEALDKPVLSGLRSLGVEDGKLHEILAR